MKISIRDFGRVKSADIELEKGKIVLIGGRNGTGKTTTYTATQAILAGERMPSGLPMTCASQYVRYGTDRATVRAVAKDDERTMIWNPASVEVNGLPAKLLSRTSAGLQKVTDITEPKKRAAFWIELLNAAPAEDDWKSALLNLGYAVDSKFTLEKLESIKVLGVDATQKENWQQIDYASRRFCEITGQKKWGKVQSLNWQPADAIELDLSRLTLKELEPKYVIAVKNTEAAVRAEGATEGAIAIVKTQAEQAEALEKAVGPLYTKCQELGNQKAAQKRVVDDLALKVQNFALACPHCTKAVEIKNNQVFKSDKPAFDEDVFNAAEKEYDEANAVDEKLSKDLAVAEAEWRAAKAAAAAAQTAAIEYARLMSKKQEAGSAGDVGKARAAVALIERQMTALKKRDEAHELDKKIRDLMLVDELLQPSGLRQTKLEAKLDELKKRCLDPLSNKAGWLKVQVSPDLQIFGWPKGDLQETPYAGLSESQQLRTDIILTLAIANIRKESTILLDRLDCMEAQGFEELCTLLKTIGFTALICMKAMSPSVLPDLQKMNAGTTYWVSKDGVVEPIGVPV